MNTDRIPAHGHCSGSFNRSLWCGMLACSLYVLAITPAYATGTPMGDVLCLIVDWMCGNLGQGLATIGISVIGIGACLGKVSWGMALTVMTGCIVMLNATYVVASLGIPTVSC
jgi:type IV secretory pathway VirB2 component (pilin)